MVLGRKGIAAGYKFLRKQESLRFRFLVEDQIFDRNGEPSPIIQEGRLRRSLQRLIGSQWKDEGFDQSFLFSQLATHLKESRQEKERERERERERVVLEVGEESRVSHSEEYRTNLLGQYGGFVEQG